MLCLDKFLGGTVGGIFLIPIYETLPSLLYDNVATCLDFSHLRIKERYKLHGLQNM